MFRDLSSITIMSNLSTHSTTIQSSTDTTLNLDLRSYQRQGIAEIDKHISEGVKRILRQNYTGTGKSIEQLFLAARHIKESSKNVVLFLCPTEELIENLANYLLSNGIRVSYIKSGRTTLFNSQVYIASVATLVKRLDTLPIVPTLIMADECHHSPSNTWNKCLNNWDCLKIGFSATPERLDGKSFTSIFDVMVEGKPYSWYIENGFLAQYRIAPIKALSANFRKRGGDYDLHEQQEFYNNPKITGDAVKEWSKHCLGEKTIVFASGIDHSIAIVAQYNEFGMIQYGKNIAEHLDGSSDANYRKNNPGKHLWLEGKKYDSFRKYTMDRFKLPLDHPESLLILSNFQLFVEGVDVPDCNVTQWLRLTASEIIWDQGNGRSGRYKPEKIQTILDHVGNLGLHGLPDRSRVWSLEGKKAREATRAYQFICKGCNKLLATDYRKLLDDGTEWIDCPSCDSSNLVPTPKKELRGMRKPKEVDLDGELEFIDLETAKTVNLLAKFRKFQALPVKKFFDKLIEMPDITLEGLKMACNFKEVSDSYAYSAWSKKLQKLMSQGF
jgi:superfamily II DNA or RNA helicase